jgi:DNA repair exonuclease SbcCD ATPase subunit
MNARNSQQVGPSALAETTGGAPTTSASLQSVVASFQERTNQLAREKNLLDQTQKTLEGLKAQEQRQQRKRAKFRRAYMVARQGRDAMEVEALEVKEMSENLLQEIQDLTSEIAERKAGLENENEHWRVQMGGALIVPHRMHRSLYSGYLRGRINAAEQTKQSREEKRRKIEDMTQELRTDCREMDHRKGDLVRQGREMEEATKRESAEAHSIADKVRETLAERQQLRGDLRRVEEKKSARV